MLLKNRKIRINIQDDKGRTPLHHAIMRNHVAVVRILLSSGAKTDVSFILNLNKTRTVFLLDR